MKKKIIHILCHTIPLKTDYIFDGWSARTARYLKKYSKDYQHECYFAVTDIKQKVTWKRDGIKYIVFPAKTLSKTLESFFAIIFSPDLFAQLKNEVKSNDVIIHIQGERGSIVLQTIHIARNNPIFIQFHGYSTPKILHLFEKLFITPLEKYYFKFVKHFFVCMKDRVNYLVESCLIDRNKISLQNLGVDYELFKPYNMILARKKLRLPLNKTIFLYVGRFDKVKGVKKIIDANNLIKNRYNTYLILIGGAKSNEFYEYAKINADLVIERIEHNKLINFFNASDVYCMLCPPEKARSGGMGVAPCEALACDKPILSSNLFEAPRKIQNKIGLSISTDEELTKSMIFLIKNKNKFKNVRTLTEPYYSWKIIAHNILNKYES